jgi:HSP20 family protein
MLMRFDPFREIDRFTDELAGTRARRAQSFPMDAYRRGDDFMVHFDLPGVQKDTIELTVERNVLTVKAERRFRQREGDELLVSERPQGTFARQLFLGDTLDSSAVRAEYADGVLSLTIPVAERAKPRRVEIKTAGAPETIEAAPGGATEQPGTGGASRRSDATFGGVNQGAPGGEPER